MTPAELQQRGRLSQRCPSCGLVEACGATCTACFARTGLASSFTQEAAAAAGRRHGHGQADRASDKPVGRIPAASAMATQTTAAASVPGEREAIQLAEG